MTLIAIHYVMVIAFSQMEFSYTNCMHLYRFVMGNAVPLPLADYAMWEIP